MNIKPQARALIDSLPDGATWRDLQYAAYAADPTQAGRLAERELRGLSRDEAVAELEIEDFETFKIR